MESAKTPKLAELKEYWLRSEYERIRLRHKLKMAHIQEEIAHKWSVVSIAVGGTIAFVTTILRGR